jgi:hypothetical protein
LLSAVQQRQQQQQHHLPIHLRTSLESLLLILPKEAHAQGKEKDSNVSLNDY